MKHIRAKNSPACRLVVSQACVNGIKLVVTFLDNTLLVHYLWYQNVVITNVELSF